MAYYEREEITFEALVSGTMKLLTEEQFVALGFDPADYKRYLREFYLNKILGEQYAKELGEQWFKERGLCADREEMERNLAELALEAPSVRCPLDSKSKEALIESGLVCGTEPIVLVSLKNISALVSLEKMIEQVKSLPFYRGHRVMQDSYAEGLRRTLFLVTSEHEKDEYKEALMRLPNGEDLIPIVQKIDPRDPRRVRETSFRLNSEAEIQKALSRCRKILAEMSSVFGVDASAVSGDCADTYILALRKVFNFCYYCCKKYDSVYEMLLKCGTYHVRGSSLEIFNYRKFLLDVAFYSRERGEIFDKEWERKELTLLYRKEAEERVRCLECGKLFMNEAFAEKHLRNKHSEALERIRAKFERISKVLGLPSYHAFCLLERKEDYLPKHIARRIFVSARPAEKPLVSYADLPRPYPVLAETVSSQEQARQHQ